MPSDSGDRLPSNPQNSGNPPSTDTDSSNSQNHIPCPRCDSNNTKFCYYNNYNLSQPRHFCKSCRRYWTQGGTLRNIPVGGGTRKNNSSAKRIRTNYSTTTTTSSTGFATLIHPISVFDSTFAIKSETHLPLRSDFNLNNDNHVSAAGTTTFTSLLNNTNNNGPSDGPGPGPGRHPSPPPQPAGLGAGFLALGGFGLGLGSGFEDIGFDFGKGLWAPLEGVTDHHHEAGSGATWQVGNGGDGDDDDDGGFVVDGDHHCFTWPELAISTTTRKGLK